METVYFVPGHGCTQPVFQAQMHALQNKYRCVFVDLREYATIEQVVSSILNEAPDRFFILGFSLGAAIALHVTQIAPQRIKGHIHISLPFEGPPEVLVQDLAHVESILPQTPLPEYIHMAYKKYFSHLPNADAYYSVFSQMLMDTGKIHYLEQAHMLLRPWSLLAQAHDHHPVLILGGALDHRALPHYHQTMAKQLKNSTLHLLENAGHFLTLEQPELSSQIILEWLGHN